MTDISTFPRQFSGLNSAHRPHLHVPVEADPEAEPLAADRALYEVLLAVPGRLMLQVGEPGPGGTAGADQRTGRPWEGTDGGIWQNGLTKAACRR